MRISDPVFYDCEASGLNGLPIEIGWAFVDTEGAIRSEGHLIKPPAAWNIDKVWDRNAESLHGISIQKLLVEGKPPFQIAQRMNEALAGRQLFSDSPMDEAWIMCLFEESADDPAFTIRRTGAEMLIAERAAQIGCNAHALQSIRKETNRLAARTHRAEADARHLATIWGMLSQPMTRSKHSHDPIR